MNDMSVKVASQKDDGKLLEEKRSLCPDYEKSVHGNGTKFSMVDGLCAPSKDYTSRPIP